MAAILLSTLLILTGCNSTPATGKFAVSPSSPNFPVGEIETQIRKTFPLSGIKKINASVSYFPFEDAVCLRYRSDYFAYQQFWSVNGREVFLRALDKYNADYDARDLDMNNKKAKSKYGGAVGYLIWQMSSVSSQAKANMDMDFGYAFNEKSPYFAVTQNLTTYEDKIDIELNRNSQEITMFFTRAQAQELAALFDQEFLKTLIPPGMKVVPVNPVVDVDEY